MERNDARDTDFFWRARTKSCKGGMQEKSASWVAKPGVRRRMWGMVLNRKYGLFLGVEYVAEVIPRPRLCLHATGVSLLREKGTAWDCGSAIIRGYQSVT